MSLIIGIIFPATMRAAIYPIVYVRSRAWRDDISEADRAFTAQEIPGGAAFIANVWLHVHVPVAYCLSNCHRSRSDGVIFSSSSSTKYRSSADSSPPDASHLMHQK